MALKSHMVLALLVVSFVFVASAALGGRKALRLADSDNHFVALDPKDPKVVELAKFAIVEYNKEQKANLSFTRVVQAAYANTQQGASYALVIAATNGTTSGHFDANVIVNNDVKKLVGFK